MRNARTAGSNKDKIDLNSKAAIAAAILFGMAAVSIFPVMPVFVGALVDHLDLTPRESGYIAAADVIAMAIGNALAFFWVRHFSWRVMAAVAMCILVFGNLLCVTASSFDTIFMLRFLVGLGEGTALALTYAMMGGSDNPDRNYGLFLFVSLGVGAVNVFVLSLLAGRFGAPVFFVDLALLSCIPIFLLRHVPDYGYQQAVSIGVDEKVRRDPAVLMTPVVIALIANLVYFVGQGGVWAYMERIGTAEGLTHTQIATALSSSLVMGVVGALAASILNVRWGRVLPLAFAIIAVIFAVGLLQWQVVLITFVVAVGIWNFANNFGHPFLLGYLAAIDKSGRYVVVSGAMQTGGMGLGPALAALVLTSDSYDNVLWFGLACFGLTLLLFLPIMILVRGVDNRDIAVGAALPDEG